MKYLKKMMSALALTAGILLMAPSIANAQDMKNGEKVTVKGEVLDMACYMHQESRGAKHASCAASCINNGAPMGVIDDKGNVYLMVEDHQNAQPYADMKNHAAETVNVTGTYYNRGGTQGLVVEKVESQK